jgi:transketolase
MDIGFLKSKSRFVRRQILEIIVAAQKGHIGGSLSCTDILVSLYYGDILRFRPNNPSWIGRDRFILSKGHSCEVLYAILADLGFISESLLASCSQNGNLLGGHPDRHIAGVEIDTGSLGHGLGIGAGLALSAQIDNKDFMTYVLLGDGECYEGAIWEAAMFAAHHNLNNLVAIVDRNKQITLDYTEECNALEPFAQKWVAFGWHTVTVNGHSFPELISTFKSVCNQQKNMPIAIIANTVKGKGISFMEGNLRWHHGLPSEEQIEIARKELA